MSDWIGPRKETWYEHLLPQRMTDTINGSPIVNALGRYMNRTAQPLSIDPDKDWLMQQARGPSWFDRQHPSVQDGANTLGMLANFIGPGAKMQPRKTQTISSQHYLDDKVVQAKQNAKDYTVLVSPDFEYDGSQLRVLLDGHHRLAAARADGVEPNYVVATKSMDDRVGLLEQKKFKDFLDATYLDGDWYNVETNKYPWR